MEKRLLLAFSITLVFFLGYSHVMSKYFPQQPAAQSVSEKNSTEQQLPFSEKTSAIFEPQEVQSLSLPSQTIGNFIVTYSPLGGYVESISIGTKDNILPFRDIGYLPEDKDKEFKVYISEEKIEFKGPRDSKKEYIFKDYNLTVRYSRLPSQNQLLFSNIMSPSMLNQRYQETFYAQEDIIKRSGAKKVKNAVYKNVQYAGARDRYYCCSLLRGSYDLELAKSKNKTYFYAFSPLSEIQFYIGPQTDKELKLYGLQGVVYYGFFHAIGMLMIKALYFFFFLTKSWGLSIICLAILIYVILFPFTAKSTKAMRKMQQIQPAIEELKKKYKDTPQKLQKETMELYRKYKVNPLGGCLPLFFQFPIFISLYQVLFRFVELKGASFLWINDLSVPDHLFGLPFGPPVNYFNLLPLLIVVVGLIQQKMTISSSSSPEQKKMGLFFSVFLGVIFYNFPSALVLYWFVQNLLTLLYQVRLSKTQQN
ncbi:MAG: membrane protein insertase YidC [Candidatus Omnitrophota bacterium]